MTTRPFAGGFNLGVTGIDPQKNIIERVSDAGALTIPGEWRDRLTERIRIALGEKDTTTEFVDSEAKAYMDSLTTGNAVTQQTIEARKEGLIEADDIVVPDVVTTSSIPDKNTWDNRDTDKLVLEITQQVFNELEAEGFIPSNQNERDVVYSDIRSSLYQDLYRPRNPGDLQYVEGNNYYASLTPLDQKLNITVATFEDLIERNGKDNWNLNFKTYRMAEIREELFEQELILPEVYEALKGSSLYMEADYTRGAAVEAEAAGVFSMMSQMEPTMTREALDRSDSNSYRNLISSYVKSAKPNDIKKGIFNTTAENLPITEAIVRNQAAQERQRVTFDRFAAEGNLKEGVNTLLGFLDDDEDGINKKARSRFLTYLQNQRAAQIRNGMPDDELIQFMFNETLKAGTQTRFNPETQMEDESIWDTILRQETEKVQAVKDENARKEWQTQQDKARKAQEKFDKEQQSILDDRIAFLEKQQKQDESYLQSSINNPEKFRETYLGNSITRESIDDSLSRLRTRNYGMSPSGRIAELPDITYVDQQTGELVRIEGNQLYNHIDRMSPRLAYQLDAIYSQSPKDMFDAQMGGGIPTPPFDPNLGAAPSRRADAMYTPEPIYGYDEITGQPNYAARQLDEQGNVIQRPIYPYAPTDDPDTPDIDERAEWENRFQPTAFPGLAPTEPEPEPQPRLPHPDYIPPTPTPTVVGSSFDLSPFDQGMKDVPISPVPGAGTGTDLRVDLGSPEEELL
jgi:hypothetical protein